MALNHRQLRVFTREMAAGWIATWRAMPQPKPTLKNYIAAQVDSIKPGWSQQMVNTSQRDDYPDDETPLMQILADDFKSYG